MISDIDMRPVSTTPIFLGVPAPNFWPILPSNSHSTSAPLSSSNKPRTKNAASASKPTTAKVTPSWPLAIALAASNTCTSSATESGSSDSTATMGSVSS